MKTLTEEKVEQLRESISAIDLDRLNYRLSDAIREGSTVTEKAEGWGNGERACAMHAAVISASARGYIR